MPPMTAFIEADDWLAPSWWNAMMTPMTVPNRPMNGAVVEIDHSEYVRNSFGTINGGVLGAVFQAAAEAGLPAAAAAVAAATLLVIAVLRRARGGSPEFRASAAGLAAVLCTGAVSALTWFPLQRPASSLALLLAAGRAWRIAGRGEERE